MSIAAQRDPGVRIRVRRRFEWSPYLLALPFLVCIGIGLGYPLVRQLIMSFQEFGLRQQFGQAADWVGIQNYVDVLTDSYFWTVAARSLLLCAVCVVLTMAAGIGLATYMLQLSTWVRVTLQAALLLAWAMPVMSSLTVWQWLFDARYGVVNYVLTGIGLDRFDQYNWLASAGGVFLIAAVVIVWGAVPLVTFMVYAALSQVPGEVLEAAQLDGANSWQRLTRIQLPMIAQVVMLTGLLQIIWDLRAFTQVYVLQQASGMTEATNVLGTYVYRLGVGQANYGMASALATVVLLLILVITWRYLKALIRQGDI